MSKSKVAVFIDLANINSGFEILKKNSGMTEARMDFQKLISMLTLGSEVVIKSLYTETRLNEEEQAKKQKFLDYLRIIGFNVVTKDYKVIMCSEGEKNKANFDVEIAVDACRCIWRRDCNEIILVSGDSDFSYLIKEANKYDIKVTVVSTKSTVSKELREQANRIILLDDLGLEQITNSR